MARTRHGTRDIQIHNLTFPNADRLPKSFFSNILQIMGQMTRGGEERRVLTGNHVTSTAPTLPKHYLEIRPISSIASLSRDPRQCLVRSKRRLMAAIRDFGNAARVDVIDHESTTRLGIVEILSVWCQVHAVSHFSDEPFCIEPSISPWSLFNFSGSSDSINHVE
jgi:hypothetical protein